MSSADSSRPREFRLLQFPKRHTETARQFLPAALEILETWLHDVSLAAASDLPPMTNLDLAEEAAAAGKRLGTAETIRRLEMLRRTRITIEQNAAPRLQMERMVLELNGITVLTLAPEVA